MPGIPTVQFLLSVSTHPGGPSLPGPQHLGDSATQKESRAQRWAAGETGDEGECVEAGDGAGVRRGTWASPTSPS